MGGAWQERWGRLARAPYTLLLAAAAAIQLTQVAGLLHAEVRPGWAAAAAAIFVATCVLAAIAPVRADSRMGTAAPYLILAVAACWRLASDDGGTGLGGLVILAVVWAAYFGGLVQLWLVILAGLGTLVVSDAVVQGTLHPSDWARAVLVCAVTVVVGPTIHALVRRGAVASEQALAQQRIYQLLAENLPLTTVMLLDAELRCLAIGGHWLAKTGQSPEQFRGRRIDEFFEEPDRRQALQFYERARGEPDQVEMEFADGRCYEFQALPLAGPNGERLVMSLARDVTDRRRAEQERQQITAALAASEQRFRDTFEAAPIGMAITDIAGPQEHFLRVNPAFAAILGRAPEDLVGRPVAEFTHPDDITLQPDLRDGAPPTPLRKRFLRPFGQAVWVDVSYTVVRGPDGRPAYVIKQIQDVQTIKESERALLAALEQQRTAAARLVELDRIRTELVATVSHDLRTPLTSVRGYLELLADEPLSPAQQAMVEVAVRNTDRLTGLVDNLLVLARLDEVDPADRAITTQIAIGPALQAAADTVRPAIVQRAQTLRIDCPQPSPIVRGDAEQLHRVFENLLSNAAKYTGTGGHLEAQVTVSGAMVQIAISDTGVGIPLDEQAELFKRFYRTPTARGTAISGNGLGLAIVKSIVERHAGSVSVSSRPGAGSTFTVSLPAQPQPAPLVG